MSDGRSGERARPAANGEHEPDDVLELIDELRDDHEHLRRVIEGDPTGELGRQEGLASIVRRVDSNVLELLRLQRAQGDEIAELRKEVRKLKPLPSGITGE